MMKWNSKKFMALALSATMVVGSSMTAFAADEVSGGSQGSGVLEGSATTDVFKVELPTVAAGTFNFKLDPEQLVKATAGAALGTGATFDDAATVFFARADADAAKKYMDISDKIIITNKSTMKVDVTVTANISGADEITMSSDKTFGASATDPDTNASLYLALTDGAASNPVEAAIDKDNGASLTNTINEAPAGSYKAKYDPIKGYTYELDTTASPAPTFATYSFQLTGAANPAGDWSELKTVSPSVDVTWTIKPHRDPVAPSIAKTSYTFSGTPFVVKADLGAGNLAANGISSITIGGAVVSAARYSLDSTKGELTFDAAWIRDQMSVNSSRTYEITFDDTANTKVSITITK